MPDVYAFPHICRLFFLEHSAMHDTFKKLGMSNNFPLLTNWYYAMRWNRDFTVHLAEENWKNSDEAVIDYNG